VEEGGREKFVLTWSSEDLQAGWQRDNADNRAFYTDTDARFGVDVRAVNWGSRASQTRRFEILAEIAPLGTHSVLDVGCGQGDFYAWLQDAGHAGDYLGIDITPRMVQTASRRFPGVSFREADLMGGDVDSELKRDWVFASGIFYLRRHEPFQYMKSAVRKMFGLANKGLAFNSLSSWSDRKGDGEFYADPLQVLMFCRGLKARVALRHDYHPGDFTIYMLKEA
jgi:SAM-dependent methyltransferase